ncbi:MAG: GntR family transcriptional regulator [Muricomes sp.]
MSWDLDNSRPIYLQLMERIQQDIIAGVYNPGDKLPSVQELALDASVNPNTMQKALSELERSGLVYSQRTSGRFITEDENMLKKLKLSLASEHIHQFFEKMTLLGFKHEEILELIEETLKEDK